MSRIVVLGWERGTVPLLAVGRNALATGLPVCGRRGWLLFLLVGHRIHRGLGGRYTR